MLAERILDQEVEELEVRPMTIGAKSVMLQVSKPGEAAFVVVTLSVAELHKLIRECAAVSQL